MYGTPTIYAVKWLDSHLYCSTGLVYLRFSGLLFYEHGKLVWKSPEKGSTIGRLMPWMTRDPSMSSCHLTGESSSNEMRGPTPESNVVGKHLKNIARRLMLYPFGELLLFFDALSLGADELKHGSILNCNRAGCGVSHGFNGRLDAPISTLRVRWGKKPLTVLGKHGH